MSIYNIIHNTARLVCRVCVIAIEFKIKIKLNIKFEILLIISTSLYLYNNIIRYKHIIITCLFNKCNRFTHLNKTK